MKILIVKTSAIGDVIQTLPVLSALRQRFPDARIDWVVEKPSVSLLKAHPELDHVLTVDTKAWRRCPCPRAILSSLFKLRQVKYDLIFDLQGNWKSALFTLFAKGNVKVGFDKKSVREKGNLLVTNRKIFVDPHLPIQERYLSLVSTYLGGLEPLRAQNIHFRLTDAETHRLAALVQETRKPRIMICFGSKWINKQLPESTLAALLERVAKAYDPSYLFVFGSTAEQEVANRLHAQFPARSVTLGEMSLPLWQAVMRESDLVFAVDSAALHLCATTTTPSLSLFGPTQAAIYKPPGAQHHSIQGPCPYGRSFVARCPALRTCPTGACLRELSVESLFQQFAEFFTPKK